MQRYATIVKRCATTVPIMVKKMQKCATIVKGCATTVPTVHGRKCRVPIVRPTGGDDFISQERELERGRNTNVGN